MIDTGKCHICKAERPDDKISVQKHTEIVHGVSITQNVRYCNDNPDCIRDSYTFRFIT